MALVKLKIAGEDARFIRNYIKAGWAKTKQEAVRQALIWFFWDFPKSRPKITAKKMGKAELNRKKAELCQNIVSAYRIACISKGWVTA